MAGVKGNPKLSVFVPTGMATLALQRLLIESLPAVDVVVLGRYRDLENGMAEKPDAILALQPTLRAMALQPIVIGTKKGSPTESFVLLSVSKAVDSSTVKSVGAVDILGRQGMRDFVATLLAGASPKVERVTKVDDLLSLLQLASVDAVLVAERLASSFQTRSKLDLRTTPLPGKVGLPALAVLTPAGEPVANLVRGLAARASEEMGVDRWA